MPTKKPVAVSGIQASGNLHIGNYIGAIKQFVELQDKYKMFVFVADLHAITVPQEPTKLHSNTFETVCLYLACGLDPKKTTIFVQSHVPQHTELGWILNTMTPLGELFRMTQYKEKSPRVKNMFIQGDGLLRPSEADFGLAGLLNYPTLMAADILLYKPEIVPVGEDQLQHLELTRTLSRKFNSRFGETFIEPKSYINNDTKRIMGLDDPSKKMSKSAESKNNYIALLDSEEEIRRKIKIAVTDSQPFDGNFDISTKPAIENLINIYSAFSELSTSQVVKEFSNKQYSEIKESLMNLLIKKLVPIQEKYYALAKDQEKVLKILKEGSKKAEKVAEATMKDVRKKIGLLEI